MGGRRWVAVAVVLMVGAMADKVEMAVRVIHIMEVVVVGVREMRLVEAAVQEVDAVTAAIV
jgi:hypothetical protein